jgi:hypothetical protein
MLFPNEIIEVIAECAHWADRLARVDLIAGYIVSENDYTSNFTTAFRRELNGRAIPGLTARIQVLNPTAERELGVDACIVLNNKEKMKIGIFEAKWPRLSTNRNSWDSRQRSTGESHFHSQLSRQSVHSNYAAIWEMFYCEYPLLDQPSYFPNFGSACSWHENAYEYSMQRPDYDTPWTDEELIALLERQSITISDVIKAMCVCKVGRPMPSAMLENTEDNLKLPHKALVITFKNNQDSLRRKGQV